MLPCKQEPGNAHAVLVCKNDDIVGHVPRTISPPCYTFLGKPGSFINCRVTGPRRYSRDMPKGGMEVPCIMEFKGRREEIDKVKWVLDKQRQNRECCHVKYSTDDIKESTADAAEGSNSNGLQQTSVLVKAMYDASSSNASCSLQTNKTDTTCDTLIAVKEESHGTEASESVVHLLPASSCYLSTEHSYAKGEPQSLWVQFGNSRLMTDEKVAINYGKQLNDRHINHKESYHLACHIILQLSASCHLVQSFQFALLLFGP